MPDLLRLGKKESEALGKDFSEWIQSVKDGRRKRLSQMHVKALRNWEGKAPVKQFPWPGASNAVLNITATHGGALKARLRQAGTAQDPTHLVLPNQSSEVVPGVSADEWARYWQNISKWIEKNQIDYRDVMEQTIDTFVIYGDAWVYVPWEHEFVMDVSVSPKSGKLKKVKRDKANKVRLQILHPKDVFIRWDEKSTQEALRVGFRFDLGESDINGLEAQGIYDKKKADQLRVALAKQKTEKKDTSFPKGNYYQEWGGQLYSPDEFERQMKQEIGEDNADDPNRIQMANMFARVDLDGDGIPEEIHFHVDIERGIVPFAEYARELHRERPLVQFRYDRRVGSIFSRGVPEILFNIQKILNTVIRDVLDNNKVQNTKMFLARKGSPVSEKLKAYPGRVIFVDDLQRDFMPIDMGTGKQVTSVADIAIIQQWGERLTGITDFNLGQEGKSRTPATTTLARLEEGNKRIDDVIVSMRSSMRKMHAQVLSLYFQNGNPDELAKIAASKEGDEEKFKLAFNAIPVEDFHKFIKLETQVSSGNLNRAIQRQEKLALFAQVEEFYEKVTLLAQAIGQAKTGGVSPEGGEIPPDPAMESLFMAMARGGNRLMAQVLDTFDVKQQDDLNPDFLSILEEVQSGIAQAGEGNPGRSNPGQQAGALAGDPSGQPQPNEAPGRPSAGNPRVPGPTPGSAK